MPPARKRKPLPPLKPGFSQLHWIKFANRGSATPHPTQPTDDTNQILITSNDLAAHNTRHDCWMAVDNLVYDVTNYLPFHPGSIDELMRAAGDDATDLFNEAHPWVNASTILETCCVGRLAPLKDAQNNNNTHPLHVHHWRRFQIYEAQALAHNVVRLSILLGPGHEARRLGFKVGEHIQLRLPATLSKPVSRVRAYTPTSHLKAIGHFELIVFAAGDISDRLCALGSGDEVDARGPRGVGIYGAFGATRFMLPSRAQLLNTSGIYSVSELYMATAGSGITAVIALLRSLAALAADGASDIPTMKLIHCARSISEIPLISEFESICTSSVGNKLHLSLHLALSDAKREGADEFPAIMTREQMEPCDYGNNAITVTYRRLDTNLLRDLIPLSSETSALLICGPATFNMDVSEWSRSNGWDDSNIHVF